MAFRPEVLEIVQIGKETAYGDGSAANRQLYSLKLDLDPKIPTEVDMAQGSKSPVGVVVGKEYSEIGFSGNAALNDLLYLFSSVLEQATITTPGGGTNTRRWTFFPSDTDADTFDSFTIEKGSSLGASKVAGIRVDELELTFVPEKSVDVKGKMFGKAISDGITMTASPTKVAKKTLSPRGVSVYIATSEAGLGAGQVKPLEIKVGIKNRHTQVFSLDSAETSFEQTVEKSLMVSGQMTLPQSAATDAYMTNLRAGDVFICQILWIGANIEGSLYYTLDWRFPFVFREPKRNPKSDVHCAVFDLQAVHDDTFGGSVKAVVDTILTAL